MTSELLFELYNVPSVTYGIDSLFAFSRQRHKDGLAISLGHQASTLIPVVDGRGVMSRAKRYVSACHRADEKNSVGRCSSWGTDAQAGSAKVSQLSYQSHSYSGYREAFLSIAADGQFMYRETCYFSSDYEEELRSLGDPEKMSEQSIVVQFPFNAPVSLLQCNGSPFDR